MAINITDITSKEVIRKLNKLEKKYDTKTVRKILIKAGKPVIKAARSKINDSDAPHKRYNSKGDHVATYYPGNLKRSLATLPLKKSNDVFIGPKITKGKSTGEFRGRRVDAYYAHMVEGGTINYPAKPYMRPAAEESRGQVNSIITNEAKKILNEYNRENARI
jgi:HK97 gp10 family phage protein